MRKFIVLFSLAVFIIVFTIESCTAKIDERGNASINIEEKKKEYTEQGWEIVGEEGHCTLYFKIVEDMHVYWSVCDHSDYSSSVSSNTW